MRSTACFPGCVCGERVSARAGRATHRERREARVDRVLVAQRVRLEEQLEPGARSAAGSAQTRRAHHSHFVAPGWGLAVLAWMPHAATAPRSRSATPRPTRGAVAG